MYATFLLMAFPFTKVSLSAFGSVQGRTNHGTGENLQDFSWNVCLYPLPISHMPGYLPYSQPWFWCWPLTKNLFLIQPCGYFSPSLLLLYAKVRHRSSTVPSFGLWKTNRSAYLKWPVRTLCLFEWPIRTLWLFEVADQSLVLSAESSHSSQEASLLQNWFLRLDVQWSSLPSSSTYNPSGRYIWPLPYTQSLSTLHPLIPVAQSFRGCLSNCKTLLILPLASALASIMTYCLAENKVT